jgi:hypothetical protein
MTPKDCIGAIESAAGRKLSDDELDSLYTALKKRADYIAAKETLANVGDAAMKAAEQMAGEMRLAAVIEKRNAALNTVIRAERTAWAMNVFGSNIAEGLEALLAGVNRAKEGARNGAVQVQEMLKKSYRAGFATDLARAGGDKLFASGQMDREVSRALWAFGRADEAQQLAKLPKEAVAIGRVIAKWQELARVDANEAGAWIGKIEGYITRQSHDPARIRGGGTEADYQTWKTVGERRFDLARMLSESNAPNEEGMLRGIWQDLASGNHFHLAGDETPTGFKGPGNLAKKLSQSRTIHFKSADDWFDYNAQFGLRNLRESVVAGLDRAAEATGLMRTLGTNPRGMFQTIRDDLIDALKGQGAAGAQQVTKIGERQRRYDMLLDAIDGSMNIPGNALWARRGSAIRVFETLTKLGAMLFSQFNDVAIYSAGVRHQGRGFYSGMGEVLAGFGRGLKDQERRELLASLGVTVDNMIGELGRVGSFAQPGLLTKSLMLFQRLNLSNWWVDHLRASAALGSSHHLALQADKAFEALSPEYKRLFTNYGISAAEWDAIRASAQKHQDGLIYIVPENVEGRALQDKLRNYFVDQTGYLTTEPTAKTRAIVLQGTRPGTWSGEMARFMLQFKPFTAAYMERIVGRELYGRGYAGTSIWGALTHGGGEASGLINLILWSTISGYTTMVLKDLAKGRTPRDPTESPAQAAKVLLASMVQGGGAGIYGDFLFGEASRSGGGTLETLAGPTFSEAGRVIDLYHRAIRGEDVAASGVRELLNNTPFAGLFYTRAALDYLLVYRIQEALNPGYLRRMERTVEKQNAQTFIARPSELAGGGLSQLAGR